VNAVDAAWLTRMLRNRYPGIRVDRLKVFEFIQGHTGKLGVAVSLSGKGRRSFRRSFA